MKKFILVPKKREYLNYESDILIQWITEKYRNLFLNLESFQLNGNNFLDLLYPECFKNVKVINVIDIGGGGGLLYYLTKRKLPHISFSWNVIETDAMVNACSNFKIEELQFHNFNDFMFSNSVQAIDWVILNSSIQYFANPTETLRKVISLKSKYVYFGKTPLNYSSSMNGIQLSYLKSHGPQIVSNDLEHFSFYLVRNNVNILDYRFFRDVFSNIYKIIDEKKNNNFFFYKNLKIFNSIYRRITVPTFDVLFKLNSQ